ncbi:MULTISPECIES: response regulator [unclassified Leisingera]|uniref:response regulator n=1 Tax=unclassified Leisingera TaxID=2614906 RepID=UPI000310DCC2|nr:MULTISPECIES: response regulator [unclassified Leisingera]KIC23600.1 two-component response regulator [Leisingera sp. ANG-S3]KIC52171.1 two-component response regulator [Leisingera sp. ANG-S]KID09729.1 two-component response regulator [Leisingera sp. ANG1]
MTAQSGELIASQIGANLPYLRRYARALTGSQDTGDKYALATLEGILAGEEDYDSTLSPKLALFRVFHAIWSSSGAPAAENEDEPSLAAKAQKHLRRLTPNTREALLLHTIEEFSAKDTGRIMGVSEKEASELISIAYEEMARATSGQVMIIEDEAVIAMDLEAIVTGMGHSVTGIARTETRAKEVAAQVSADLILSDIQLADNSSGIDAVNGILATHGERPVIFITAYPERLLTGEGPEPAFLISKPYTEEQVHSAVSQAMFFSSTETLKA